LPTSAPPPPPPPLPLLLLTVLLSPSSPASSPFALESFKTHLENPYPKLISHRSTSPCSGLSSSHPPSATSDPPAQGGRGKSEGEGEKGEIGGEEGWQMREKREREREEVGEGRTCSLQPTRGTRTDQLRLDRRVDLPPKVERCED